ncbi:MAG: potassium channel family protein [Candidatus Aminicenantes bacterium]|nr:potassium channel family protein [Candidatus Aminicenantes bacterium]
MSETKIFEIPEGLKLVNKAKENERNNNYSEAAKDYKAAMKIFRECNQNTLYAKCLVAHSTNMIKYYLEGRDIEALSDNRIDKYIENIIKGVNQAGHKKLENLDILITAYQELEGIFDKAYMKEEADNMYYEKTKLLSKYYWQIARSKEKGNIWVRIKVGVRSFFSRFFHWYCGYGERPLRAMFISLLCIFSYSWIYCCHNLIDYSTSSVDKSIGWLQSFYFSVVTFTTLGFGDIVPKPGIGQFAVATEVMLGYLLLGTMVAILIRKITR